MKKQSRTAVLTTALLAAAASLSTTPAHATPTTPDQNNAAATRCSETSTPVKGSTFGHGTIRGTLCAPKNARTLQVLLHGYTYDRHYWDFPYKPAQHSYVDAANKRGYATLALDRLGSGKSTHPPSSAVTYDANAASVHQVIQAARSGELDPSGQGFDSVVLVGHSYGSITSYLTAGRYPGDVDAVIATGAGRSINLVNTATIAAGVRPSFLDPKFAKKGYDPGYVTLSRKNHAMFFAHSNVDSEAISTDYRFRQASSLVEITTGLTYGITSSAKNINIPVLTINGDKDTIFCQGTSNNCSSGKALAASQRSFFGPRATVEGATLPGAGHSFNMENNAPAAYRSMLDFCERHVRP